MLKVRMPEHLELLAPVALQVHADNILLPGLQREVKLEAVVHPLTAGATAVATHCPNCRVKAATLGKKLSDLQ